MWGHRAFAAVFTAAITLVPVFGVAANAETVKIELNKAQMSGDQCNMYFMLQNKTGRSFENYKLDLVFFDQDGIIAKQMVVETAPLAKGKTVVKAFPVKGTPCDGVSRLLLNKVTKCVDGEDASQECTAITDVSSKTDIEFIK